MLQQITRQVNGEIVFQGEYETIKSCIEDAIKQKISLSGADLYGEDLYGADLRGADLRDADLRGADLRGANLRDADLRGADLRGANLYATDLRGANLYATDLRGADLYATDLRDADLRGANLRDADLRDAALDMSCLPLRCGGLKWKIDRRLFAQIAYHLCSMDVDDAECKAAQKALLKIANEMHRTDVPRLTEKEI